MSWRKHWVDTAHVLDVRRSIHRGAIVGMTTQDVDGVRRITSFQELDEAEVRALRDSLSEILEET